MTNIVIAERTSDLSQIKIRCLKGILAINQLITQILVL